VIPRTFNDRFQQMMNIKLIELRKEAADEFSKASADAVRRGHVSPSSTAGLHNRVDVRLIEKSITAVVELQRELISSLQIPYSDTLATELKDQVKSYVSPDWCEELHKMNSSGISDQYAARLKEELIVNRTFFLKRAEAQITFLVDTLRTQ
jgi:hypothetical protein